MNRPLKRQKGSFLESDRHALMTRRHPADREIRLISPLRSSARGLAMSSPFRSRRQGKALLWAVLLLVIAAGVGAGAWWWRHLPPTEQPKPPVDMTALLRLNNEGVGQME